METRSLVDGIFQSTPPVRGATTRNLASCGREQTFQSTPPVRGATFANILVFSPHINISIHAPRAGGDSVGGTKGGGTKDFNPRPPCGGRRPFLLRCILGQLISIHAPRAGGDECAYQIYGTDDDISIHAPRAGGDGSGSRSPPPRPISIHAPRAGGDVRLGSTSGTADSISIHAPRAGGDVPAFGGDSVVQRISIHAPRAGGDAVRVFVVAVGVPFQSTPPVRGATAIIILVPQ